MPLPDGCWPSHDTGKMAILVISAKYVIAAAIDVESGLPEQKSESWELFSRCVLKNPPFWIFGLVPYFRAIRPPRTQFFTFFRIRPNIGFWQFDQY
tara:strand:+ start:168 stop:455 length:288 start_codon:yes stop_codon:yes gene_type:complete